MKQAWRNIDIRHLEPHFPTHHHVPFRAQLIVMHASGASICTGQFTCAASVSRVYLLINFLFQLLQPCTSALRLIPVASVQWLDSILSAPLSVNDFNVGKSPQTTNVAG